MSTGAIIGIIIAVIVVVAVGSRGLGWDAAGKATPPVRAGIRPPGSEARQQEEGRRRASRAGSGGCVHLISASFRPSSRPATAATGPRSRSGSWTPRPRPWAPHTCLSGTSCGTAAIPPRTGPPAWTPCPSTTAARWRVTARRMDLRTDSASTEQLREAMIRYRALFEDLTGLRKGPRAARPRGGDPGPLAKAVTPSRGRTRRGNRRPVTEVPRTRPEPLPGGGGCRGGGPTPTGPRTRPEHAYVNHYGREISMTQDQYRGRDPATLSAATPSPTRPTTPARGGQAEDRVPEGRLRPARRKHLTRTKPSRTEPTANRVTTSSEDAGGLGRLAPGTGPGRQPAVRNRTDEAAMRGHPDLPGSRGC